MRCSTLLRWSAVALIVTAALAATACSSSSNGGSGTGGDAGDAGAHDATNGHDATSGDSSAGDGFAPMDAKGDATDDAGLTCSIAADASTTCNTCIESYCDPAWCACAQDTTNVDDAGANGCERYVACVAECVATDAGLPTTCTQTLCAHAPYSSAEQQEGKALLDCLVLHCSVECPQ